MFSTMTTVIRNWGATPRPTFQTRTASGRWARFAGAQQRRTVRVTEVVRESPTTSTFVLETLDRKPLVYLPGQHLTVLAEIDGVSERRCYSFSTDPGSGAPPAITVKHVPEGRVSGFLTRNLTAGQTLRIAEPTGVFTVEPDPAAKRRFVLVAGGVGITPLASMGEAILRRETQSTVTLVFGNRDESEILFRRRLANLAAEFPSRLRLVHALDQAPEGWKGERGPLTGERVIEILGGNPDGEALYFVCGPAPMMDGVTAALLGKGVTADRVRVERFEYAAPGKTTRPTESFAVRFASGAEVRTVVDEPILATALRAGVTLEYSCQMGGCGACKVKTSRGSVVHDEPNCLTAAERDEGYVLACCAFAAEDVDVASV